jgi:hypothetical protein
MMEKGYMSWGFGLWSGNRELTPNPLSCDQNFYFLQNRFSKERGLYKIDNYKPPLFGEVLCYKVIFMLQERGFGGEL